MARDGLLAAIRAGLSFDAPDDDEARELQQVLTDRGPEDVVHEVMEHRA